MERSEAMLTSEDSVSRKMFVSEWIMRRIVSRLNDGWGADPESIWEVANRLCSRADFSIILSTPPMNRWFDWEVEDGRMQVIMCYGKKRYALTDRARHTMLREESNGLLEMISKEIGCDIVALERELF